MLISKISVIYFHYNPPFSQIGLVLSTMPLVMAQLFVVKTLSRPPNKILVFKLCPLLLKRPPPFLLEEEWPAQRV